MRDDKYHPAPFIRAHTVGEPLPEPSAPGDSPDRHSTSSGSTDHRHAELQHFMREGALDTGTSVHVYSDAGTSGSRSYITRDHRGRTVSAGRLDANTNSVSSTQWLEAAAAQRPETPRLLFQREIDITHAFLRPVDEDLRGVVGQRYRLRVAARVRRTRLNWRKVILKIERILQLEAWGIAISERVTPFGLRNHSVGVNTEELEEEEEDWVIETRSVGVNTEEEEEDEEEVEATRNRCVWFLQYTTSVGISFGGHLIRSLFSTAQNRRELGSVSIRFLQVYAPAIVVIYQNVPTVVADFFESAIYAIISQ